MANNEAAQAYAYAGTGNKVVPSGDANTMLRKSRRRGSSDAAGGDVSVEEEAGEAEPAAAGAGTE